MAERRRRRRLETPEVPTIDKTPAGSGLVPDEAAATTRRSRRAATVEAAAPAVSTPTPRKRRGSSEEPDAARERARARAAEILEHDIGDDEDDKFHVPAEIIPDGWKYLWRRRSTYGKEDPQYMVKIAQTGWTAVPAERHPEMMPSTGGPYLTIEREGMILMEIPLEVYKILEAKEQRKAIEQVRVKTAQIGQAPPGHFARDQHPKNMPSVKRGYEPLIVPDA